MKYTIDETKSLSAYEATLTFDENILPYTSTNDFAINIRDRVTNNFLTLDKDSFTVFGITSKNSDLDMRADESLIDNGGMLLYFPTPNSLYIKQLIPCQTELGNIIGFNSCAVNGTFNGKDVFTLNTKLLPAMFRDPQIVQEDLTLEDPVLKEPNLRQEYDYDANDHDLTQLKLDTNYQTNYTDGDQDSIYVNTPSTVPCYTSTVSAFLRSTLNPETSTFSQSVSSYLYDDQLGTYVDIDYLPSNFVSEEIELPYNLTTELQYCTYKQYLRQDGNKLYKNRLILSLNTDNIETIDPLNKLQITFSDPNPSDYTFTRKTIESGGSIKVTIKNQNSGYTSVIPTIEISGLCTTDNIDESTIEFDEESGSYSFILTGFSTTDTGSITVTAWLDVDNDVIRTAESIKTDTKNSATSRTWLYKVLPLERFTISDVHYFVKNGDEEEQDITNTIDVSNPAINIDYNDVGKITAIITNPNTDYIDTHFIITNLTEHPETEQCQIDTEVIPDVPNAIKLIISNIKVSADSQGHIIQFFAYMSPETEDFTADEVKKATEVYSTICNWIYKEAVTLQHLTIQFSDPTPAADDQGIHWLQYQQDGSFPTGSIKVTINNPNKNYLNNTDYPLEIDIIETTNGEISGAINPQNIVISEFDYSTYPTTGDVTFTITNITTQKTPEELQTRHIYITAWINHAIADIPEESVKLATVTNDVYGVWKYKVILPDIGPDDKLRKYSLYTLSDLTINGGKVGSRTICCLNLTCNNNADINSQMELCEGYTFVSNSANTYHKDIKASYAEINNPSTFEGNIYIKNHITLRENVHIPVLYLADGATYDMANSASIGEIRVWEDPDLPTPITIDDEEVEPGTGDYVNGDILRSVNDDGEYDKGDTVENINRIIIDNRNGNKVLNVYPGKYHMNSLSTETGSKIYLHTRTSTDSDDGSVSFYIANNVIVSDFTEFIPESHGIYDFRIYYEGTGPMSLGVASQSPIGTIKAPKATVELRNNARWIGSIWAKEIVLQNNAELLNDY